MFLAGCTFALAERLAEPLTWSGSREHAQNAAKTPFHRP